MTAEMNEDGLTEQDRRDIAEMNAELGSVEFPIRVPIFVPNSFGTPAMEVGVGVFENESTLTVHFIENAPGKAVRRMMRRDIVLGLQFVMLELEKFEVKEKTDGNEDPS